MSNYNPWLPVLEKVLAALPDQPVAPDDAFLRLVEAQVDLESVDQTIQHFENSSKEKLDVAEAEILKGGRRDLALKTAVRALMLWQALAEQEINQ